MSSEFGLTSLPDLALINIAKHLSGADLLNFTHTCSKVFYVVGAENVIWREEITRQKLDMSSVIEARATELPLQGCPTKKFFLCSKMILSNMTSGVGHLVCIAESLGPEFVVSEDSIFWLDWPEVRCDETRTRIAATMLPVIIIYEYDGINQQVLKHEVRLPEPLLNGQMVIHLDGELDTRGRVF